MNKQKKTEKQRTPSEEKKEKSKKGKIFYLIARQRTGSIESLIKKKRKAKERIQAKREFLKKN